MDFVHTTTADEFRARQEAENLEREHKSKRKVPHSFAQDGKVRFKDTLMLCMEDQVFLRNDLWKETSLGSGRFQVYVAKSSDPQPTANSTFVVEKIDNLTGPFDRERSKVLHYGQPFRLTCDPSLVLDERTNMLGPLLYLASEKPNFSQLGADQPVFMQRAPCADCNWMIIPVDGLQSIGNRNKFESVMFRCREQAVTVNKPFAILHCMTNGILFAQPRSNNRSLSKVWCESSLGGNGTKSCTWELIGGKSMEDAIDNRNLPKRLTRPKDILQNIKRLLVQRAGGGIYGIREISRSFRVMDTSKDGLLQKDELRCGLEKYHVYLDNDQINSLFEFLDRDNGGTINIDEFLVALRGPLSKQRLKYILKAYGVLDRNKDSTVTLKELCDHYDTSFHPEIIDGTKSHEEVVAEFASQWDKDGDGTVTKDEFVRYYRDVSASIDDDEYFTFMMINTWHINETSNTSNIRVRVQHGDGSEEIVALIDDFGISRQDIASIRSQLLKQGVCDIKRISLSD